MRVICPYCGKSQDGRNETCQFCQAKLPNEFVPDAAPGAPSGPGSPDKGPDSGTGLCGVCMKSFPAEELEDYEGHLVCRECMQKMQRRDTSMAPAMKKVKEKEAPRVSPRKRFVVFFLVGLVLVTGAAFGGFQAWKAVGNNKARVLKSARKQFKPVIDHSNQAFVILIQETPDKTLLEHADGLLDQCVKDLDGKDLKSVCEEFPPLERYRSGFEEVILTRLSCARTLNGRRTREDPVNAAQARQRLTETREQAVECITRLVQDLRLYGLEVDGLIFY